MKKRLKSTIKKFVPSDSFIGALVRRIYYRKAFNTIKRMVHGKNNTISHKAALLSSVVFDIQGDDNTIEIQKECILNNVTFHIRGNGHRVLINRGCRFNQGGNIWFEDSHCLLSIGEFSTFENVHFALTEPNSQVVIGKDCMFAYDIDIRTGDSHSIISQETDERINYAEDINIGNHVWVAAHSILLKGSTIPPESVIATGSIITGKFTTAGIIIAGNPARKIKDGITWSRKRTYEGITRGAEIETGA